MTYRIVEAYTNFNIAEGKSKREAETIALGHNMTYMPEYGETRWAIEREIPYKPPKRYHAPRGKRSQHYLRVISILQETGRLIPETASDVVCRCYYCNRYCWGWQWPKHRMCHLKHVIRTYGYIPDGVREQTRFELGLPPYKKGDYKTHLTQQAAAFMGMITHVPSVGTKVVN